MLFGALLVKRLNKDVFTAYQASDRGGLVKVRVGDGRVYLSGQAVTVFCAELKMILLSRKKRITNIVKFNMMRKTISFLVFVVFLAINISFVFADSCSDSDGGKNYENYGVVTVVNETGKTSYEDSCKDWPNYMLDEAYCEGTEGKLTGYDCRNIGSDYTCSNGRCMVTQTTLDTQLPCDCRRYDPRSPKSRAWEHRQPEWRTRTFPVSHP